MAVAPQFDRSGTEVMLDVAFNQSFRSQWFRVKFESNIITVWI